MAFCRKCSAELPADAQFCPRCGTAATFAAPPPPPPPAAANVGRASARQAAPRAEAPARSRWWIAPAVVVGLVLIAWLVLAGLPFGGEEPKPGAAEPTETIAEAEPQPGAPGTLIEVPPGSADDSFEIATTTTQAPPIAAEPAPTATAPPATTPPPTATAAPPAAPVQRPPVIAEQPRPQPQPPPRTEPQRTPPPAPVRVVPRPDRDGEISAAEAEATLRSYVRSSRYYPVAGECIRVENRGYRNVGYNLEVWHSCPGGGVSRLLGRWRVDSKTREVFRQREDGRYLRP